MMAPGLIPAFQTYPPVQTCSAQPVERVV